MKFMISQPMAGKTIEQIYDERDKGIRVLTERGYMVIDSVFTESTPELTGNVHLWYLARSLDVMAECDGVLFMPGWEEARGCRIEHEVADAYGLIILTYAELEDKRDGQHDND